MLIPTRYRSTWHLMTENQRAVALKNDAAQQARRQVFEAKQDEIKAAKDAKPRRPEKEKAEGWKGTRFTTPYLRAWLKTQPGKTSASEGYDARLKRWHDLPFKMDAEQRIEGRCIGHSAGQPGEEKRHWRDLLAQPGGLAAAKERYAEAWWSEWERDKKEPVRLVKWW